MSCPFFFTVNNLIVYFVMVHWVSVLLTAEDIFQSNFDAYTVMPCPGKRDSARDSVWERVDAMWH